MHCIGCLLLCALAVYYYVDCIDCLLLCALHWLSVTLYINFYVYYVRLCILFIVVMYLSVTIYRAINDVFLIALSKHLLLTLGGVTVLRPV